MINVLEIKADKRSKVGKASVKKDRKSGKLPAVIYGMGKEPVNIVLDKAELMALYRNSEYLVNAIFSIEVDGKKEQVITQDLQREPISKSIEHVDFIRINEKTKVTTQVPVVLEGTAAGQKLGGVVIKTLEEIKVSCFPQDIPVVLKADISSLGLGDVLFVKNLPESDVLDYVTDASSSIVYVEIPRSERSAMAQQSDEDSAETESQE